MDGDGEAAYRSRSGSVLPLAGQPAEPWVAAEPRRTSSNRRPSSIERGKERTDIEGNGENEETLAVTNGREKRKTLKAHFIEGEKEESVLGP